jgi:hypothetical protein
MGLKIKVLAFIIGLIFFGFVLRSLRKNVMRPSYAFLWICMSLFLLSISVLEPLYKWISVNIIGIVDARHIIYIALIGFLLVYVFYLTGRISQMSDQIQILISQTSILEQEIKDLRKQEPAEKKRTPETNN